MKYLQGMNILKWLLCILVVFLFVIFFSSVDGYVRCYDIRKGKLRSDNMHSSVGHISLSNDGNCILVGCLNNTVRILSKDDGTLFLTYVTNLL